MRSLVDLPMIVSGVSATAAEIVAMTSDVGFCVVMLNAALVDPGITIAVELVVASGRDEERETTAPFDGEAALRLTVPTTGLPPSIVAGFNEIALTASGAGSTTSCAEAAAVPALA